MRNEKEERFQDVRFLIPSKGADFRHIVVASVSAPTAPTSRLFRAISSAKRIDGPEIFEPPREYA